ncbi:MAG TPA: TniQ family protein [Candidatus Methylomirabilis sp.]|nr:TniQ family protein [Candidatus Methylomirabilis sp.]
MGTLRWPLHPQPRTYETLEAYVHRLAGCYGARYDDFCCRVLGLSHGDKLQEPAADVLRRLSEGTGVPFEQLARMTWRHIWNRLMDEMHRIAATPEARAELERVWGFRWLQKS